MFDLLRMDFDPMQGVTIFGLSPAAFGEFSTKLGPGFIKLRLWAADIWQGSNTSRMNSAQFSQLQLGVLRGYRISPSGLPIRWMVHGRPEVKSASRPNVGFQCSDLDDYIFFRRRLRLPSRRSRS